MIIDTSFKVLGISVEEAKYCPTDRIIVFDDLVQDLFFKQQMATWSVF